MEKRLEKPWAREISHGCRRMIMERWWSRPPRKRGFGLLRFPGSLNGPNTLDHYLHVPRKRECEENTKYDKELSQLSWYKQLRRTLRKGEGWEPKVLEWNHNLYKKLFNNDENKYQLARCVHSASRLLVSCHPTDAFSHASSAPRLEKKKKWHWL